MSDNFKRYNCIKSGLRQLLPKALKPNELKMLDHLSKLVNGIIGAGHSQLSKVALKDPRAIKTESKIATLKRLVAQEKFSQELFWLPFVREFLASLVKSRSDHAITLIMDGSVVGRGCMALVMNLVYAGRSLTHSLVGGPFSQRSSGSGLTSSTVRSSPLHFAPRGQNHSSG